MFLGGPSLYGKPCGPKWSQMCFWQIIRLQENKVMLHPCFFHSCKWPHWAQMTIRSQPIFQHFIRRENTSGPVMEEIYSLPHPLHHQWLASFLCGHVSFLSCKTGQFLWNKAPFSAVSDPESFNAVISHLCHRLQIQFQGSRTLSLSTLGCVAFVSVSSKAITLGSSSLF